MFLKSELNEKQDKFIETENNSQETENLEVDLSREGKLNKEYNTKDYSGIKLFWAEVRKYHRLSKDEEKPYILDLQNSNEEVSGKARDNLIKHNLRTVWEVVKKQLFGNTKHEFFEELISAGYEALCQNRVFTNFDPSRGVLFSAYISVVIQNEVKNHYRALQIQRPGLQGGLDIINTYRYFFVNLERELGRPPYIEELNQKLHNEGKKEITLGRYEYLFEYTEKGVMLSLDGNIESQGRVVPRSATVEDPRAQQGFADVERRIDFRKFLEIVEESKLTDLEKKLLFEYHYSEDKISYKELGLKYGISYETARQKIIKAEKKIQKILTSKKLTMDDFL